MRCVWIVMRRARLFVVSRPHMFRHRAQNVKHDLVAQHLNASTHDLRLAKCAAGRRRVIA
jgi:hypothetical protein